MQNTKKTIFLTVNGKKVETEITSQITLAELLRENLGLTGTKVGCNRAECGSCTVLLNGEPVYSCTILAVEVDGKDIFTVEGLEKDGKLHPLQEEFINYDALQCGYCTPGMLMSIISLLNKNPSPTEADIKNGIDGNLCRCGCYPNIIKATLAASKNNIAGERKNNG